MTTIEDKINLFSKIIYDKVNEEKENKLEEFYKMEEKKLSSEKEKITELRKNLKTTLDKKYNIKANEIISREKLNKQKAILMLKDELVKNTLSEVKARLLYFISSQEYKYYFLKSLRKSIESLEAGRYKLIILERDYKRFYEEIELAKKEYSQINLTTIFSEEEFIGGIIIMDENETFKIDNSLYSKLEESREIIGIKVMDMLA